MYGFELRVLGKVESSTLFQPDLIMLLHPYNCLQKSQISNTDYIDILPLDDVVLIAINFIVLPFGI